MNIFIKTLLLLILVTNLHAQSSQETLNQKEEPSGSVTHKISEVPSKLEEATAYLAKINDDIIYSTENLKRETELNIVKDSYEKLRYQTDSIKLGNMYSTTLKEFRQRWSNHKRKISGWTDIAIERTKNLEETKLELLKKKEIWSRTYKLAIDEKAPADLLNSIRELQYNFGKTERNLVSEINSSLSMQTRLSEQNIDVELTLSKIDELLVEKKRKVFSKNAPAIWNSFAQEGDTTRIGEQFEEIWNSYIRTVEEFYDSNKNSFLDLLLIFLIILGFVYWLRKISKQIAERDHRVTLAFRLLERPVATAFLVFILLTFGFLPDIPDVVMNVMKILFIFPLLRILIHLGKPVLKIPLLIFGLLVVAQQFLLSASIATSTERGLLLLISFLTIVSILWFFFTGLPERGFEKKENQSRVVRLGKLIIILISVSIIANFSGYVMLSLILTNGTINSLYALILLFTAAIALYALIITMLQTKPAQKINVVRYHIVSINKTIAKIIKLFVFIWALRIVLKQFGIFDFVYDKLTAVLNTTWPIGDLDISFGDILIFFISIWLALLVARFVKFILEGDILPRMDLPRGIPGAISSISYYLVITFGIIIALVGAGIDFTSISLLVSALGVGIGFGLQDIVRNFISGLILIFERPIQVSDAVQVDDLSGRVTRIGIRSSVIKTWEGAEVIVPNGNLISNKLVNWTLSDQRRRIDIKVGVAYGSDVKIVMRTLLDCVKERNDILKDPAPYVLFNDFADSSLDFELRCWTSDYPNWVNIRSDIRISIDDEFKKAGINIPFPQRDLHIIPEKTNDVKSDKLPDENKKGTDEDGKST